MGRGETQLPIDQQHLAHLGLEVRVPPLEVIADFVGLEFLPVQDALHGGLAGTGQSRMTRSEGHLAKVVR